MVFQDIASFIAFFSTLPGKVDAEITHQVTRAAVVIEADAKARIGTYQQATGPFPAWAPLADATLNGFDFGNGKHIPGKIELGYAPPDNPLKREGELRDSIRHTVQHHEMAVGSDLDKAVWQERGTKTIPPRSFLGAAAAHQADDIARRVGHSIHRVLSGLTP